MKSLIILTWAAIAHATCGYQHGIWKPRDGQDFSLVMKELAVNRKDIEKLNPDVDIDDICSRTPYNVPFKVPQYSGQWTNGCPPLLIIRDTMDGLVTYSGLPSIWNTGYPYQTLTRTIQVAVATKTRTITVYATKPPVGEGGTEGDANNLSSHTKPVEESAQTDDGSIDTALVSKPSSEAGLVDPSNSPSYNGQEKSPDNIRNSGEPAAPAPTSQKDAFRFSQTTYNPNVDMPSAAEQDGEQSNRLPSTTAGAEDKKFQSQVQPTTGPETTCACKEMSEAEGTKPSSVTTAESKPADNSENKPGSVTVKTQHDEASNLSHKTAKVDTEATETAIPTSEPASSLAETGTILTTLPPPKATPKTSVTSALVGQATLPKAICAKQVYDGYYLVFDALVKQTSRAWCLEYATGRAMQAGDEQVSSTETDPIDREANYSISWVEDCIGHAQSMDSPLGSYGPLCSEIFYDAVWWSCRKANNGFGGYVQAGCLNYTIYTGPGDRT